MSKTIQPGFARRKTGQPPCGRGKSPLWRLRRHLPPGGKRVTGFSVAQGLPTARLSPTHWILRSLMLPYESSLLG